MGDDNDQNDNAVANRYSVTRRTAWWGLTVFSVICVAAFFSALGDKKDAGGEVTRADKWSGSVTIISMALAFIACLCSHFFADHFVDKWLGEGAVSVIVLAVWAAGLAAMMDPDNLHAVTERGGILNANLYFFAWASLAASVWIFCSFVTIQNYVKRGDDSEAPPNMTKWYLLVAASFVVMTSSIRLYTANDSQCSGDSSKYCKRVKYALSLGAAAVVFGLVEIAMSNMGKMTLYPEAGLTFMLFVLYVIGIAVITFGGSDGPGTNIGNLYFSTWLGFVLAMFLTSKSWNAVRGKMKGGDAEEAAAEGDDKADAAEAGEAEAGEAEGDDKKVEDAPPEAPLDAVEATA